MARELEEQGNRIDHELIRQFMLFTNDLDSSRETKFRDLYQEMIHLLAEDGIQWTDETLFFQASAQKHPSCKTAENG